MIARDGLRPLQGRLVRFSNKARQQPLAERVAGLAFLTVIGVPACTVRRGYHAGAASGNPFAMGLPTPAALKTQQRPLPGDPNIPRQIS